MLIDDFKKVNTESNIYLTAHARKRLAEREIGIADVVETIRSGEIIEEYPEDYPFPSCLILGMGLKGRYIHIVVSLSDDRIYLITAYVPSLTEWEKDLKTRRK